MLSKSQEKYVKGLHQLKNRRLSSSFFFEGHKMAMDSFQESGIVIQHIFALDAWVAANAKGLGDSLAQKIIPISEREMKKISALKAPTPILVVAKQPGLHQAIAVNTKGLVALYLEGIQNPGNMGTIIRVADWFGVDQLIASPDSVDFFNPKVIQASMSSIFRVSRLVMDIDELKQHRGVAKIWATTMSGTPIQEIDKKQDAVILMIGNEGKGLSQKAFGLSDETVTIPGHPDKKTESLNAALAAGILCSYF